MLVDDTGGTNPTLSYGGDTFIARLGANTVATFANDLLIFGSAGSLEVLGNAALNETVVGGSG